jgi:hypothetical protein
MMKDTLSQVRGRRSIFLDGYPSTTTQLDYLRKYLSIYPSKVIVLNISQNLIMDSYYSIYVDPTKGINNYQELSLMLPKIERGIVTFKAFKQIILDNFPQSSICNFDFEKYIPEGLRTSTVQTTWLDKIVDRSALDGSLVGDLLNWVYERPVSSAPLAARVTLKEYINAVDTLR